MNVLIVGSKGFIGSNCATYLTSCGYNTIGCDVAESDEKNYFSLKSINNDFNTLFKTHTFDCCINAAGSAHVSYSFQFPEKDFEKNVFLVINLLGAIKNHSPECKLINFSSAAVYGNPPVLPIREDFFAAPLSPYGYHKLLSENLLLEYSKFFDLKTCSLRVFSAYGEGLKKQLFWDMYQKSRVDKKIILYGTGNESRDFIYIGDLVNIVQLIIEKGKFEGEVYNIGNGEEITIKEAAVIFFDAMGNDNEVFFSAEKKTGDPVNWKADIQKIITLGYKRHYSFKEGIYNYCKWLKELK